jgi:hypothetical protein
MIAASPATASKILENSPARGVIAAIRSFLLLPAIE